MASPGILIATISQIYVILGILTVLCKSQGNICFRSTVATVVTCESSMPEFDKGNSIRILNYIKCTTGVLSKDTFKNLDSLEVLSISCGYSGTVHLEIEPEVFSSAKSTLKQLNLNQNNIRNLPGKFFCELNNVTEIDLSKNALTDIDNVGFGRTDCGESTSIMKLRDLGIQENDIKIFRNSMFGNLQNLNFLNASNIGLEHIESSAFEGMTDLSDLDLCSNHLISFPPQVFENLTSLLFLNLARNGLTSGSLVNVTYPKSLQSLYLNGNRMTTIDASMFKNLDKLSTLDLSYNQLSVIQSGFSSMLSLSTLSLNNAGIEEIRPGAFNGLINLKTLHLNDNELRKLETGTFSNVPNLHQLQLSGNNLQTLPNAENWSSMEILEIARNAISDVNAFASYSLNNLKDLDLSYNLIEVIKKEAFRKSTSLYRLDLSYNKIRAIEKNAFDSLAPLVYDGINLNLDNNELTNINNLFQTTNLTSISLNNNKIGNFSYTSIPISLQSLNLSHNRINKIINELSPSDFRDIKLRFLDLSYNQIEKVSLYDIPYHTEVLDLHNNSIRLVDELLFKSLIEIKTLNLHNNKLEMLCPQMQRSSLHYSVLTTTLSGNPFYCSCELEWLKYQNSDISKNFGYIQDLQNVKCHSMVAKNGTQYRSITQVWNSAMFLCKSTHEHSNSCNCILSERFPCELPCPEKCTCYRSGAGDFAVADCSASNLTTLPVITFHEMATVYLFLDGNHINSINESSFQLYSNIKKLYLNNSGLETIEDNAFRTMTTLELLQLSHNMLQELPAAIFMGLLHLKELNLAHNNLVSLHDGMFSSLASLQTLQINNNLLQDFAVWDLSKLQLLQDVSLQHNRWSCDCSYIDKFRNWLQQYVNIVHDADKLACTDQDTVQEIPLISFGFDECYKITSLQYLVNSAPVWGSSLGVILVALLSIILIFIYRREMQVLIYSRYGVRIFSNDGDESDQNKAYDAFISYSSLDEDFLVNEFLPGLEQIEHPFHLCLHHRDFLVGAFITESIMEAVEKSRRTIMLLSDNFIKSEWCRFEFKTAHIQMMKDRCNRVVVVVLGEVPKDLDPEMKLYLRTNTFLKWGDKLFWKKLYFVLPDRNKS